MTPQMIEMIEEVHDDVNAIWVFCFAILFTTLFIAQIVFKIYMKNKR